MHVSTLCLLLVVAVASFANAEEQAKKSPLDLAREVQGQSDSLNQEMTEKMLHLEEDYHKKKLPLYAKRNLELRDVEQFWLKVMENHPSHGSWLHGNDRDILTHLVDMRVEDLPEETDLSQIHSHRFKISMRFAANNYFGEAELWRIQRPGEEDSEVSGVQWIKGREPVGLSFFNFFEKPKASQTEAGVDVSTPATLDPHTIAEMTHVLRYELWPNPFSFYDNHVAGEGHPEFADGSATEYEEVPTENPGPEFTSEDLPEDVAAHQAALDLAEAEGAAAAAEGATKEVPNDEV